MKNSKICPKCSARDVEAMSLSNSVFVDFGTFYLGDLINPTLYICLNCGFSETWIDSQKDLEDIRKFSARKQGEQQDVHAENAELNAGKKAISGGRSSKKSAVDKSRRKSK